ncbi:unnamed protein product [Ixodes persulcatus]
MPQVSHHHGSTAREPIFFFGNRVLNETEQPTMTRNARGRMFPFTTSADAENVTSIDCTKMLNPTIFVSMPSSPGVQGGAVSCVQVTLHCIGLNPGTTPTHAVFTPSLLDHHSPPMRRFSSAVNLSFR